MPQMSPLNWLTLFIFFFIIFFMFMISTFYLSLNNTKSSSFSKSPIKFNWKW